MSAALEPLALSPREAADFLSISKRSLSRLIRAGKIEARKAGARTLVDVASLKVYYRLLPKKTDHLPIVFGRRAHAGLRPRSQLHRCSRDPRRLLPQGARVSPSAPRFRQRLCALF